jgi:hypothetical protein
MTQSAFVILGCGPVALACALWCARVGRVKLLALREPGRDLALRRIEVVPIKTVAGLVELGVHPHSIGVFNVQERRLVAWKNAEPTAERTAAAAHVERPSLESALLALAVRQQRIDMQLTDSGRAQREALAHLRLGACVIDATGRRASLAARTFRPDRPWVARIFHISCVSAPSAVPFMAAALPVGYVYRAAGHRFCTVGVVGFGSLLAGSGLDVRERLKKSEAAWLVEDIAALEWTPAGAKPASIQWADVEKAAFIGDAGLARDALSSQGLACGLKDARYAAAIRTLGDRETLRQRSRLARVAHATSLATMIAACRWRNETIWREYADFLKAAAQTA